MDSAQGNASPLLEVRDLEVAFFTKDGVVRAVNHVSYALERGDTLALVGESGSGKTVSVLAMLRLLPDPPSRILGGQVLLEGRDLLQLKPGQMHTVRGSQVAVIFQDPMTSLNPVMRIGDQIAEAVQVSLGLGRKQALDRAAELLDRVGIPNAAGQLKSYPHQFSGGMRQRVMIAMAISCRPKLLIADEPTTGLDVTIQAQIVDLVKELQQELNMAMIWITHNLGVVARLANRVNVMYAGHIVEMGPTRQVFANPLHPYTISLLGSVPGIDLSSDQDLSYIEGSPPDMIRLPPGCPFSPRCPYRTEKCLVEQPGQTFVAPSIAAACWNLELIHSRLPGLSQITPVSTCSRANAARTEGT
jgi:oligopeptide transport system ATP-binding protein